MMTQLASRCFAASVIAATLGGIAPGHAADTPRIASINTCTDQLLLTLADPAQIVGLSPYSRDPARSWLAAEAAKYPRLSGEAEDVLVLKPDIIVAGTFTKRATREFLKQRDYRVIEFDVASTVDDVRTQILRMGEIVGHPERAAAQVERLDTAIARARAVASRTRYRVLPLSRRGWVSGARSLTTSLLDAAGLTNAAGELGVASGGFVSLEQIVIRKPDLLLVSEESGFAEDQGRAFLLHPALEALYPPEKRLVLPEQFTVCGGPMLADALDRLAREIERVIR
jgi:iron complex transport system substrate-binding protein